MTQTIEDRLDAIEERLGTSKKTTRVLVIQDRSGSMDARRDETISGFNEYLKTLQDDDSDNAYLTLVQFDDRYEVKVENRPVAEVSKLDSETFVPRGLTSLLDAVGKGITNFKRELKKGERALVVIMTDGGENNSREWSRDRVINLIRDCEDEGNWTFVFLGAGQDAWGGGQLLGLRRNQSVFYGSDKHSHETSYTGLSAFTGSLRSSTALASAAPGAAVASHMVKEGADVKLEENQSGTEEDGGDE